MKRRYYNIHDLIRIQLCYKNSKDINYLEKRLKYFKTSNFVSSDINVYFNTLPKGVTKRYLNDLFAIFDGYDKESIGAYYGLRCWAQEAVKTLFGNLEPTRGYRVVLRLDQGSQHISQKFCRRAKKLGIKVEYYGINCPDDKSYIESFFSRYKCEEVHRNQYRLFAEAVLGWIQYKYWYKIERIHQGLGWMTILEFKNQSCIYLAGIFQSKNTGGLTGSYAM
jgi:hypothetical protein